MSRSPAAVDVFHAVADANRRALLDALADGEAPVGALVDRVGLSYSAVSQHLAVLLDAKLVHVRQDGRQRFYRVDAAPLRQVHDWAGSYVKLWKGSLDRLKAVVEAEAPRSRR
jgi:DNA-binding transcriptional ArsR family regulator